MNMMLMAYAVEMGLVIGCGLYWAWRALDWLIEKFSRRGCK